MSETRPATQVDTHDQPLAPREVAAPEHQATATAVAAQAAIDIVNVMAEGVVLFQLDGTITTVNPAVETLTGMRPDEVIGKNLRSLVPQLLAGGDLAMALDALDEVAQARLPTLDHVELRRDTAAAVTISPSVTFITKPDGTPASAVLTLKDVTELHEAGELLNQIFDNTHMQIAYLDTDFHFVRVNRAYADACGHEPEFFSGKNHFDLYPHPENETIFRTVRDTGKAFSIIEKPFEFPDQPERGVTYWDWSLHPIGNGKGVMEGLLFCLLDVTERVRARQGLTESEQKYRELVENANSIIIRITPDHRITFFNEYAQSFFGYTAEEVLGKSVIGTIVPSVDSEGRDLHEMVEAVTADPELHGSNDNENMCKDGRRVWVHWANRALRDDCGTVREIMCIGTDMTERRALAKEAEVYRRRLQTLADRLASTEEQERRRVATHIHDTVVQTLSLSNIRLGGVMAAVEMAGLDEQRETVAGIRRLLDQGTRECRGLMETLVPSLLYEVGLHAALRDFADKQASTIGTTIHVDAEAFCEPIDDALRGLLFQCARELIMNAQKYAGPCEIQVCVSSDEHHVQLRVLDTGRGFDPLELNGAIRDHTKGGFGLFNIRERVESAGGRLEIVSAPGQGTTARVVVPVR